MIKSKRTYLRRFQLSDLDSICEMESDIEVMKYTGPAKTFSRVESKTKLEKNIDTEDNELGIWAACSNISDDIVGWFMLIKSDGAMELGFMLPKKVWGQGLATEISTSLIQYASKVLNEKEVIASTHIETRPLSEC